MYHLSFQLPIKKLMIMLPSHGQNTAAVKIILHRAGITFYFTQKEMFLINSQRAICLSIRFVEDPVRHPDRKSVIAVLFGTREQSPHFPHSSVISVARASSLPSFQLPGVSPVAGSLKCPCSAQDLHPRQLHPGSRPKLRCLPRRPAYSLRPGVGRRERRPTAATVRYMPDAQALSIFRAS